MTQPELLVTGEVVPGVQGETVALAAFGVLEAAFAAAVLAAFTTWFARVSSVLFAVLPINPVIIWSLVPGWNREVQKLVRDLEKIARMGWDAAAADLGVKSKFDLTNPVLQNQLRRTRNLMVRTPDEVYRMILHVLDVHAGDQAAQQRAVENVLDVTGTVNWPARAKTVAVTEVHRAYNFGSLAAAMNVGRGVRKTWNAKEDKATRPTHSAADGQTVPVFQAFQVGLSSLMAPGDPDGPAHEVINCRCKLSYLRSPSAR